MSLEPTWLKTSSLTTLEVLRYNPTLPLAVARLPEILRRGTQVAKGEVCKTFMQGFESPPRLHALVQFCSPLFFPPCPSQAA